MTEQLFLKAMIDLISQENFENKEKLIEILKRSKLTFDKTGIYSRVKWNYYWENICLTTLPAECKILEESKEHLKEIIQKVYPVDDNYEYVFNELIIKAGYPENSELIDQEVFFEDIQNEILQAINDAKYIIWVAVAWFTNQVLFDALLQKKKEGLNIQIIINDDNINRDNGFDYEKYFETYRLKINPKYNNTMHNKFCMIDFSIVLHGTFNWTNKANYNKETLEKLEGYGNALVFADQFMKLKKLK